MSNFAKKIQQEPVTEENAKKLERIAAYDEYLMKCHSAFHWDPDYEWYEYKLGKNVRNILDVVLHTPRESYAYRMSNGREFFDECSDVLDEGRLKKGYLTSLDQNRNAVNHVELQDDSESNGGSLKCSLRKIYIESDGERRREFHRMIEKLMQDLENQR